MKDFKDLNVWKYSHELVLDIYKQTSRYPKEEQYGLVSQIRRAVVSIPSNICEGNGRTTNKENANFLSIARGSLMELKYQLLLSKDLGYITEEIYMELEQKTDTIGKMLNAYINKLRS